MNTGLDLDPIPLDRRNASLVDVAFLFAGANIVTTTLVTGGALGNQASAGRIVPIVVIGVALGTLPLALLARTGPRFGLPSMVLLRSPFGVRGAQAISGLLILTNFAWIALNNVIAAAALSHLMGGEAWLWSLSVGTIAVLLALTGPRMMALFDRAAVPLMAVLGGALTWALVSRTGAAPPPPKEPLGLLSGLDLVAGYQVSWSLMFADYTRYQRSERQASLAVFFGLTLSSLWLMLVGAAGARAGGGADPTSMVLALGLPAAALLIVVLSTVTTNFVNLYLSSLALRNLVPRAPKVGSVLLIGAVGTGLGLISPRLLDRYAGFMGLLGTVLLPIVAVALAHFFVVGGGVRERAPRWQWRALVAWLVGVVVYQAIVRRAPQIGATLPTLIAAAGVYVVLERSAETRSRPPSVPAES